MVGFNRRFAPLLTDMRARFGPQAGHRDHPLPGERGAAGRRQLVPQRGAGRVAVHRRGRPLHRHAQLVGGQPARGGLRRFRRRPRGRPGHRAVRQRGDRDHQLRHHRQLALPEGDAGRRGRAAAAPGSTTSRRPVVWTGRKRSTSKARGGQDKGQRADSQRFIEASRTGAAMPISLDSLVATTRATIAVAESLASGHPERV